MVMSRVWLRNELRFGIDQTERQRVCGVSGVRGKLQKLQHSSNNTPISYLYDTHTFIVIHDVLVHSEACLMIRVAMKIAVKVRLQM